MNDAKVPDSLNDWQNMDIFLFSNGQLNSPPRKYHLRSEELTWWDATLTFLARSQYGSMHSRIDLYTTDGHKLEGPLQLQHGTAYVAVEDKNMFIDSGYDKYLIKATRSLEKRQAKKPNSRETLFAAEKFKETEAEITKNAKNEVQNDNAVVESTAVSPSADQNKMLEPQGPLDTGKLTQKGNSSAPIQTDKRKPYPAPRPAAFRKNSTLNAINTDIFVNATESLENRPAKRPNINETLSSVEKTKDTAPEIIIMNATNNDVQKDNAVVESDKPLKPQGQLDARRLSQKSNSSATKESDKRKPSLASRPPVFRKTSNLNPIDTSLSSRKTYLKRSNSPPKRNHKVAEKPNERPSLEGNLGSKTVTKSIHDKILESIPQPIVDPIKLEKVAGNPINAVQAISSVITSNQKSQVTDVNQVDILLNDNDTIIVSDLYKNPVSEMTSAIVDTEGNTVKRESITQELIKINEENETSEVIYRGFAANEFMKHKSISKNPSKIKFTAAPTIQAYSVSDKQDDSYLAIINRGDILNFQLKIEVRNADGSTSTAQKTQEIKANLMKLDKSSQVHIDNDLLLQSKTLYSTFTSENAQFINSDGNSKIVMVQCGCCDHYCNNVKEHNDMRLQTPKSPKGYKCDDDVLNEKPIIKTTYPDRSSIIHPIKKTYSDMSLERLEYLIGTQDMNVTAVNSTNLNTNENNSRKDIFTNQQVDTGEQQAESEFKIINQNHSESVADSKQTGCGVIQTVPTKFVDKSMQTEWNNLLLEARCQDDGRYTFHLPPLNVIKYYTM